MKPTVLIIDDEPGICQVLTFALENDYLVLVTTDADSGLLLLESKNIDLVLLDLQIGDKNGIDVLKIIKSKNSELPVIMMTAYGSIRSSVDAMKNGAHTYGATIADVVSSHDKGFTFDVMPNSGGVGNMLLLQSGQADIGLGFNCVNSWAYDGIMAFEESGAIPELRGLIGTLDQMYVGIGIRNGSGIDQIRDIAEKKLPINLYTSETGSASEYTTRLVLESIGCTYDDIISWGGSVTHTDFASIVAAYQDGKCDFFMQHISVGHAAFTELCTTADVRVGELDQASLDYLQERGYSVATMPANSFNGQTEDVVCAGITTSLVTTEALPNELAYRIVKQIYENPNELSLGHSGFSGFNKETCADSTLLGGLPMHDGAVKYFQEIGLL